MKGCLEVAVWDTGGWKENKKVRDFSEKPGKPRTFFVVLCKRLIGISIVFLFFFPYNVNK